MSVGTEARLVSLASRYVSIEKGIEELRQMLKQLPKTAPVIGATAVTTQHCDPCGLEEQHPCGQDTPEVVALRKWCSTHGLHSAFFRWVPSDYYSHSLQWRRDVLGASSIQHLCKSIVLENTHCVHTDCSHRENSRYYIIVYPFTEKFDTDLVMLRLRDMNKGLGKKKFNFRLAHPDIALQLTGFTHGAVAPFGTPTQIPVIISQTIVKLLPAEFWMGGGHVQCKVRVDVAEFLDVINPIVATITTPRTAEELESLID